MILVSIKDVKSNTFGPVVTAQNDADAVRQFGTLMLTGNAGLMSDYPSDFALHKLAEYENTGEIKPLKITELLLHGDVIEKKKQMLNIKKEVKDGRE